MQNTAFYTNYTLNACGHIVDLSTPKVMGILNVTPDSFYDGARYESDHAILQQAEKMLREGAALIDVGGYSSRPGAVEVSLADELMRTIHAVKLVKKEFPQALVSVDTFRCAVAYAAVQEGACMVNDISGGSLDVQMIDTVSKLRVPYVLMHMRGTPQTMSNQTQYSDVVKDVADYFHTKLHALQQAHVADVIIDPGFGFAKTREQNFTLLNNLDYFKNFARPIMVGLSRKSMIWKTLNTTAQHALNGTTVLNTIALLKGASILRVHDVQEAVQVIKLVEAVRM